MEAIEETTISGTELPICTTAPSAEHQRFNDEDEPCNDSRS